MSQSPNTGAYANRESGLGGIGGEKAVETLTLLDDLKHKAFPYC